MSVMILSYRDKGTTDIAKGLKTREAGKTLPTKLFEIARRKLQLIDLARSLSELEKPPNNRLEALIKNRAGQWSIRINDRYRICFEWMETDAYLVEICDYHKGEWK